MDWYPQNFGTKQGRTIYHYFINSYKTQGWTLL